MDVLSRRDKKKKRCNKTISRGEMRCSAALTPLIRRPTPLPLPSDCYLHTERVCSSRKQRNERRRRALTVLAVPSHVLPRAFTRVVGNQIRANAPILARVPFTFINICRRERNATKGALIHLEEPCRQLERLPFLIIMPRQPADIEFPRPYRFHPPIDALIDAAPARR